MHEMTTAALPRGTVLFSKMIPCESFLFRLVSHFDDTHCGLIHIFKVNATNDHVIEYPYLYCHAQSSRRCFKLLYP